MDKRLWIIHAEAQTADGMPITFETSRFAQDAGEAWTDFSSGFIGMAWDRIIVKEVVFVEGETEEGKGEGADLP